MLNVALIACKIILLILLFFAGAACFSFLNVVLWRLPRKIPFMKAHSKCGSCGHELSQRDMIPIFSWLCLGGKCRYCGAKVSSEYTVVELVGGAYAAILAIYFGFNIQGFMIFLMFGMTMLAGGLDLETGRIPKSVILLNGILAILSLFAKNMTELEVAQNGLVPDASPYKVTWDNFSLGLTKNGSVLYDHFLQALLGTAIIAVVLVIAKILLKIVTWDEVLFGITVGFFLGGKASITAIVVSLAIFATVEIITGTKQVKKFEKKKDQMSQTEKNQMAEALNQSTTSLRYFGIILASIAAIAVFSGAELVDMLFM